MIVSDEDLIDMAEYMVENKATVRQTAAKFGVSKSCVHFALTRRLRLIDIGRAKLVKTVLEENREARARRGGVALWEKKRNCREVLMV